MSLQVPSELTPSQRATLIAMLNALPQPQLEELIFAIDPAAGVIPGGQAAPGIRTVELLRWVEGSTGCGLTAFLDLLQRQIPTLETILAVATKHYWYNLPTRNLCFTGRESLLEDMHNTLATRGRAVFSGMGGIGKTQAALEYVHRYQDEYTYLFWVNAAQVESLISDYAGIAAALQVPGYQQDEPMAVVEAMKRWLTGHDGWLLVLDNADEILQLRPFLPPTSGHVLFTSRSHAPADVAFPLPVTLMDRDEGTLFLLRRARITTTSTADQTLARLLNEEMDGLPLALDQAGAFIEAQGISLEEYLELFRTEKAELLQERGQGNLDHPNVTATFTLAFEKVAAASAIAADLVRVCAFLAPDAIPEEIFSDGAKSFDAPLSKLAESKLTLIRAIGEAAKFSLISRNPQARTLTIHRLVQEVIRGEIAMESQQHWAEQVVGAVAAVFPNPEFKNWRQCDRMIAQAQAITGLVADYGLVSKTAALLFNRASYYYNSQGRYSEAEALYQEALAMYQRLVGEEHPDVATSLNNLAALYYEQGRYEKAEPLYQKALAIYQRLVGNNHPDVARSLNNLAILYFSQGRYEEAETFFQAALSMQKRLLGEEHPSVANILNGLANLYRAQGRYGEAETFFQAALSMRKRLLGEEHPDITQSLNNLALLYVNQGRYNDAESLFLQALTMRKRLLGEEHPDVATSLNNLAGLYYEQGRYEKAEPLYQKALAMRKQLVGEEHPDVAQSLNNLAALYYEQGRYEKAEPLYQKALAMYQRLMGNNHPDVARSLNNLAMLYYSQGRYGEAETLLQAALSMRKQLLGEDHPDATQSLNNLANLYRVQGRYSDAEPLLLQDLEITQRTFGDNHPTVANSLNNLANLYWAQGRYSNAEPLYLQSLDITRRTLGDDHPNTKTCWDNFVGCLQETLKRNQTDTLSDDPLTQYLLQQLESQGDNT